jgi:hypothetical protein
VRERKGKKEEQKAAKPQNARKQQTATIGSVIDTCPILNTQKREKHKQQQTQTARLTAIASGVTTVHLLVLRRKQNHGNSKRTPIYYRRQKPSNGFQRDLPLQ